MTPKFNDVVRVLKTNEELYEANSYGGDKTLGDVGIVTFAGLAAVVLDDEFIAPYISHQYVEVLEATTFATLEAECKIDAGSEVVVMTDDFLGFTKGKVYTVEYASCGCCTYCLYDDDGCGLSDGDGLPLVALLEPLKEPVHHPLFKDMSDEDKAMLLLAKFEGKPVQVLGTDIFVKPMWLDDYSDDFDERVAYRIKPQELVTKESELEAVQDEVRELEVRESALLTQIEATRDYRRSLENDIQELKVA